MCEATDAHYEEHKGRDKDMHVWSAQEISMNVADLRYHKLNMATQNYYWVYNEVNATDMAIAVSKNKFVGANNMRKISLQRGATKYTIVSCHMPTK